MECMKLKGLKYSVFWLSLSIEVYSISRLLALKDTKHIFSKVFIRLNKMLKDLTCLQSDLIKYVSTVLCKNVIIVYSYIY